MGRTAGVGDPGFGSESSGSRRHERRVRADASWDRPASPGVFYRWGCQPVMLVAAALWLLRWGFVGVSIIVATVSGAPAGAVDAAVQSVGGSYLTAVKTLRQFALSTTVSPRWVDVGYAALATVPIFVHLFLLSGVTSLYCDDADDPAGVLLIITGTPARGGCTDRLSRLLPGRTVAHAVDDRCRGRGTTVRIRVPPGVDSRSRPKL